MAIRGWKCQGCNQFVSTQPWCCPTCRKEICDMCFDKYAHCKDCAGRFTDDQLIHAANAQGFDFEEHTNEPRMIRLAGACRFKLELL